MRSFSVLRLLGSGLAIAAAAMFTPCVVAAQTSTGNIRGIITTEAGAPLPGAEVTARHVTMGVQRTATSGDNGFYSLAGLRPGEYEVTVRRIGVAPQSRRFPLQIGQTLAVDFRLAETAVTIEAVTVTAEAVRETRTTEVATNVSQEQIENLPSTDRNFLALAGLAPGVRIVGARQEQTTKTFAAGAQGSQNVNVFIDGASYKNDVLPGGVAGQEASRGNPFPQNAVQEFRIITENFKAEYQKASSAIITATTRSGGNTWDGDLFLYGQGKDFIGRGEFDDRSVPKPDYQRYLGGANIGGPLIPDRLHLFAAYEANLQDRSNTVLLGTPANRPPEVGDHDGTFTSPFRSHLFFGKLTYELTENQSLEFSTNFRRETDIRGFGGQTSFESAEDVKNEVTTALLKHRYASGPWLNEAMVSFQRYDWTPTPLDYFEVGREYFGIGRVGGRDTYQQFKQDRLALRNDVTFGGFELGGQHVIKTGVTVDFLDYTVRKELFGNPVFRFRSEEDFAFPFEASYGVGNPDLSTTNRQIGLYLQDDWTPHPRFTMHAGIRWDYESDMMNNDYVTPQLVQDELQSIVPARYFTDGTQRPPFRDAFQPRLGFSLALDDANRTVVFGGFGVFYDRTFYNAFLDEKFRLQYGVRLFRFSEDGEPRDGQPTIAWDDSYMSRQGLDALIASGVAPLPEVFLIDNETRPPRANHFSAGVRRTLGNYLVSASYSGVRSHHGMTFIFGNRNPDGTCCMPLANFSNVLLSSDDVRTWYDALYLKVDRPYRPGGGWGAGISYTLGKARQIGGDLFSLDFPTVNDYPKYPTNDDQRHFIVANGIVDLPLQFQFSSVITLGSGVPYFIFDASQGFGPNEFRVRRNEGRPPKQSFIIPNAFAFRLVDVRLRRDFFVRGNDRIGLVADLFNVFNFQNYGCFDGFIPPETDPPNENFGRPGCVVSDARRLQLGAQYSF